MNSEEHCQTALELVQSNVYSKVIAVKCLINVFGLLIFAWSYLKIQKSKKFAVLHLNVRYNLNLQAYFVAQVAIFMLAGNLLDLFRLMSIHRNPCGYMLPFWLTFLTRESYMFGVLGQTITFVTLSIERIYATLHRFHEFSGSRLFLALSTILIFIICFLFAFVYMGYDADWSAVTEMVTQNNEYNEKRIKYFVYIIIACECFSLVLYNVTYFLNHRDKNRVFKPKRRVGQISKSLTEKYQTDENRKVAKLMLPMCWIHFILYISSYGIWLVIQPFVIDGNEDTGLIASLIEALGFSPYYTFVFSYFCLKNFVWKPKFTNLVEAEMTSEYFKQMNSLFRSG